jgi:hypothetical protein
LTSILSNERKKGCRSGCLIQETNELLIDGDFYRLEDTFISGVLKKKNSPTRCWMGRLWMIGIEY